MPRYALLIDYHGGPFKGWQRQRGHPSVQGALAAAVARLDPDAGPVYGAGRTDAGVHATGQVAHVDLAREWEPFRLGEALNHHLKPQPVAIVSVARVADAFHARFDALGRRYLYRVRIRRAPLTHEAGLVWAVRHGLDVEAMQTGAEMLVGRHDFTTFRSAHCQASSPVRTLDRITISRDGDAITFALAARSFLHNQVRSIVGTLERVGAGAWTPPDVDRALAARDRSACGPIAPSAGLYLTGVVYEPDPFGR